LDLKYFPLAKLKLPFLVVSGKGRRGKGALHDFILAFRTWKNFHQQSWTNHGTNCRFLPYNIIKYTGDILFIINSFYIKKDAALNL
jgi:hypothetical protein